MSDQKNRDPTGTRAQRHEIRIQAPADAVWRAVTDPEELTRWYVSAAEVEPRVGGSYKVSWGEGMDGVSVIRAFEPGRRLRIEHRPQEGSPDLPGGPIVEEFVIEAEGGTTILRLVTSGIPDTEDWDWFYDGTERGWTMFFLGLRHYLERHAGSPRQHIVATTTFTGSFEEAWPTLLGPRGLGLEKLDETESGAGYAALTAAGDELRGEILLMDAPYRLLATVEGLDDALLSATLERMGPSDFLYLSLSIYGLDEAAVDPLRKRWKKLAEDLFPSDGDPASAFQAAYGGESSGPETAEA